MGRDGKVGYLGLSLGAGMDITGGLGPPSPPPPANIVTKRHDICHKKVQWTPLDVTIFPTMALYIS